LEHWGRKLIFIVQDVALRYLEKSYDTSGLHPADPQDSLYFYGLSMIWDEASQQWQQHFARRLGTNTEGVRRLLGGLNQERYPDEANFKHSLLTKLD